MQIIINGSPSEVRAGLSVAELIDELGLTGRRLAIEINTMIVPRSQFDHRRLAAGDRVEIIHAVGGG